MRSRWHWVAWTLVVVGSLAAAGIAISTYMFSTWTELVSAGPEEADREFARTVAVAGGGPPYLEIGSDGAVRVHRELESEEPAQLVTLHLLAWEPEREGLLRMAFPYWFVRAKTTSSVNLGTITSILARDWDNLDLSVSVEELERRGPGLVMDHRLASGARVLLWSEAPADP